MSVARRRQTTVTWGWQCGRDVHSAQAHGAPTLPAEQEGEGRVANCSLVSARRRRGGRGRAGAHAARQHGEGRVQQVGVDLPSWRPLRGRQRLVNALARVGDGCWLARDDTRRVCRIHRLSSLQ